MRLLVLKLKAEWERKTKKVERCFSKSVSHNWFVKRDGESTLLYTFQWWVDWGICGNTHSRMVKDVKLESRVRSHAVDNVSINKYGQGGVHATFWRFKDKQSFPDLNVRRVKAENPQIFLYTRYRSFSLRWCLRDTCRQFCLCLAFLISAELLIVQQRSFEMYDPRNQKKSILFTASSLMVITAWSLLCLHQFRTISSVFLILSSK